MTMTNEGANTQLPPKAQEAAVEDLQKVAQNPNPRANENLSDKEDPEQNEASVGTEITDGEGG